MGFLTDGRTKSRGTLKATYRFKLDVKDDWILRQNLHISNLLLFNIILHGFHRCVVVERKLSSVRVEIPPLRALYVVIEDPVVSPTKSVMELKNISWKHISVYGKYPSSTRHRWKYCTSLRRFLLPVCVFFLPRLKALMSRKRWEMDDRCIQNIYRKLGSAYRMVMLLSPLLRATLWRFSLPVWFISVTNAKKSLTLIDGRGVYTVH